jgi:hypothetical protein
MEIEALRARVGTASCSSRLDANFSCCHTATKLVRPLVTNANRKLEKKPPPPVDRPGKAGRAQTRWLSRGRAQRQSDRPDSATNRARRAVAKRVGSGERGGGRRLLEKPERACALASQRRERGSVPFKRETTPQQKEMADVRSFHPSVRTSGGGGREGGLCRAPSDDGGVC